MSYRYIKTLGNDLFWGMNIITSEDLIQVKDGRYDTLIDTKEGTYFNSHENKWYPIKGENNL